MLTDDRLTLRPWHKDDVDALSRLRNDVNLQEALMSQPRPNNEVRVRQWLEEKSSRDDGVFFVIADQATDTALGFIQTVDIDTLHGTGSMGICLAPEAQGQGNGASAIALLEDYLQRVFGLRKLTLSVLADNTSAISLYTKLGFSEIGRWTKHYFTGSQYKDVVLMEKLLAS
jgi:diamine N-acetyltransferase